jgi:uncharacterized radical SAM superfamily Fe-S cluster-containing enzyme
MTQILGATESVCPECLARIPAERVQRDGCVYLRKTCAEHGTFEAVIWRGAPTYTDWMRPKTPAYPQHPFTPVERGCPFDCGLCPEHRQQTCTALLEVTQRCNLGCPICFAASGNDAALDPPLEVIELWYRRLLDAGGPYNIQLSGGEPTLRDDLPEIIRMGRALGFGFIQVNTNGLRFAREPGYLGALVDAGLSSVFLQFDGTEDAIYRRLRGCDLLAEKVAAIEQCAAHRVGVILVPTLAPGVNLHNVGEIVAFALDRLPTVRGVHFQPVSYFGRYPEPPRDDDRVTIPEVLRAIEAQTGGKIARACFEPPGCENAHCSFHGNFVSMTDGALISWTQPRTCTCEPESAAEGAAKAREFVAQNWVAPGEIAVLPDGPSLGGWDVFLQRAKTHAFCISGMAFQDAWTLDLARLRDCCIHTVSPDGRIIPFCAYNLTDRHGRALYRGRDASYTPGTLDRA